MDQQLVDEAARQLGVTIQRPLREGGQKSVALASRGTDEVVLKVVALEATNRDTILERARREVDLLAEIDHPNLVRLDSGLVEIGAPPRAVAWLEVYLDGEDLTDQLGLHWSWARTSRMATDVASALSALHARAIVHRDLP